jgi:succinate-semialdehyde dehydrogenase/glutarate-semialdehyde dehydrogenase
MDANKLLIDGQWLDSREGKWIDVENPATEELFDRVPVASGSDVDAAVKAAHGAFPAWAALSCDKRAEYLHRAERLVLERADEIAALMTREQGKPFGESKGEVLKGAEILGYYAEEGKRVYGRVVPGFDARTTSYVLYEPVGVSAAISPWNYPIELVAWKVGGALAAGCTMVVKPPSETPLSPLAFVRCLVDAGVPKGVVNVVFGRGSSVGSLLLHGSGQGGDEALRRAHEEGVPRARGTMSSHREPHLQHERGGSGSGPQVLQEHGADLHRRQQDLRAGEGLPGVPRRLR